MDQKTALHTAARMYCRQRFSDWVHKYQQLQAMENGRREQLFEPGWDYSDEAYRTFPRYRIAQAIEVEVERLLPSSCVTLDQLRTLLLRAGDVAEERLRAELANPIAREVLREEGQYFRAYVEALNAVHLENIEPLPFRRVMDPSESERILSQLKQTWGIVDFDWFPLKEEPHPPNVMAFHTDYFDIHAGNKMLREALRDRGILRVFQIHEFGPPDPDYEIEVSVFEPHYGTGGQQYSTSETVDWVAYASHESSITLCGDWLTRAVKEKWPDWSKHTYGGPYSTDDLRGTWNSN